MVEEKISKRDRIRKRGLILSITGFSFALASILTNITYLTWVALALLLPVAVHFIMLYKIDQSIKKDNDQKDCMRRA